VSVDDRAEYRLEKTKLVKRRY